MKKSTRALAGMVVFDALLVAGAAWMVMQVRSGTLEHLRPRRDHHRNHPHRRRRDRDRHGGAAGGVRGASAAGGLNYPHQNGPHLSTFRSGSID